MKPTTAALCLLLTSAAFAAEGLPEFKTPTFPQIRTQKFPLPTPKAKSGDALTDYHLLVQAGDGSLSGYARTTDEFREATAYWTGILEAAGLQVGAPILADGIYQLPYKSPDGRILRVFLADPRQFPPKDEAGLRANMALAKAALGRRGLPVVAAHVVNVEALLPTYALLYLTDRDPAPQHERRLRVLAPGDDLDVEVYRGAGIDVVQTPTRWMMVYLGQEAGYVTLWGRTGDDLADKVAKRRELFASQGKTVLAVRASPIDDVEFKFGAALYFLQ
jgi:hypothetical protein